MPVSRRTLIENQQEELETGVYCWRNKLDRKIYVGSAAQSFRLRRKLHLTLLRRNKHHCRHLQSAWNKYGEQAFDWLILWRCLPEECLDWEQWWMDKLRVGESTHGYNSSPTAKSTLGCKHSNESSKKHSEANKRRASNPEWAKKHKEAVKKARNTPESKAKSSEAAKRAHADPEIGPKIRSAAAKSMDSPAARVKHMKAMRQRGRKYVS